MEEAFHCHGPAPSKRRESWPIGIERGGFTLVEVLAAVLLVSIGLLAVLTAAQAARDALAQASYLSIGRDVAQSRIEALRSTPLDGISFGTVQSQDPSLPPGNSVTVSVSRYPSSLEKNLALAVVTVSWPERKSYRKIVYETLIVRD